MGIVANISQSSTAAGVRETRAEQLGRQREAEKAESAGRTEERESETAPQSRPLAADRDEYVHGEEPLSAGLYRRAKDENGNPKVVFEEPSLPDSKEAASPEKAERGGEEEERCTCSTDQVDSEIEKLKKKRDELEQQMARAGDDEKEMEQLQKQLQQVESELSRKDNDAYRRGHAEFT